MAIQYVHLTYEEYKNLEKQMRKFNETSHTSEGGFYHKSIRLKITNDLLMEFHGPLVGGYGHNEIKNKRSQHKRLMHVCSHGKAHSAYCQECADETNEELPDEEIRDGSYAGW